MCGLMVCHSAVLRITTHIILAFNASFTFNYLFVSYSFKKGKKLSASIDRTVDEMHWPPGSNHRDTPAPSPKLAATASSSKAGFYELKSASPLSGKKDDDTDSEDDTVPLDNERFYHQKNSFDLSVLIGEAHSFIRFSLFDRVPPESDSKDLAALPLSDSSSDTSEDEHPSSGQREMESGEKLQERKGSHEDVMVKPPKISNTLQPQHQSVTMEY